MPTYIYNIILGAVSVCAIVIPFFTDVTYKKTKKFNKWGYVIIFLAMAGVVVNFLKDRKTDREAKAQADSVKQDKRKADSINAERINKSDTAIVRAFTGKLAEYGLKEDAEKNAIEKIVKDSSKKVTNNLVSEPNLYLDRIDLKKGRDTDDYTISLKNQTAPATQINLHYYFFIRKADSMFLIPINLKKSNTSFSMAIDQIYEQYIKYTKPPHLKNYDCLITYVVGSYYDRNNKKFLIDQFGKCIYNSDDKFNVPNDIEKSTAKAILKQNNIIP